MDERPKTGKRRRPQISMTVHPDTVTRLDRLCDRFHGSRGALVDRMTLILDKQYTDGKVYCMTGEQCRYQRTDVPDIF